jgi:hypothetical protein
MSDHGQVGVLEYEKAENARYKTGHAIRAKT